MVSCGSDSEDTGEMNGNDSSEELDADLDNATELMGDLAICINVHNLVLPEELPYKEATSFDNYEAYFPLTGVEIGAFQLSNLGLDTSANVNLAYWTNMSSDYLTYVFNVEPNEHELATYIVSYEADYTYVDHIQIAYDEIAEGFVVEESELDAEGIHVTRKTYFDEEKTEKIDYKLNDSGKFEKQ